LYHLNSLKLGVGYATAVNVNVTGAPTVQVVFEIACQSGRGEPKIYENTIKTHKLKFYNLGND
jgi:hypothetical protein